MIRLGLLLLLVTGGAPQCAVPLFAAAAAAQEPLCYAFRLLRDLYVHCNGREERITAKRDIWGFAVSPDGLSLAVIKAGGVSLDVISLKPGFASRASALETNSRLYASCGTILRVAGDPSTLDKLGLTHRLLTYDFLTGDVVTRPPYTTFRCSADGETVAGTVDADYSILKAGFPPARDVVRPPRLSGPTTCDVSPNGQYLAYWTPFTLCVERQGSKLGCISDVGDAGRLSVSDSMDVLLDMGLGQTCYFDRTGRASLQELPGTIDANECVGVARWRPGEKAPVTLELDGVDPQWITPKAASALIEWKSLRQAHSEAER